MRQIRLKCPYCSKEGYVPLNSGVRRFVDPDKVKEPVSLPCGPCAADHAIQSWQGPQRNHRFWNWFDRFTRYSLIPKIIIALTLLTAAGGSIGYRTNLIENHPVGAFIIAILLFCECVFLLGLFFNIPYDYTYDVVLNPAFKDLAENAWHEGERN